LQCIFEQKAKQDIILTFYNEMNDDVYMMMRLSKRADHWAKRINIFRETALLKELHLLRALLQVKSNKIISSKQ
jgi:hypothetical protein